MDNSVFYNVECFKVWNYKYVKDPIEYIVNSLAVLIGDYSNIRKSAAMQILKALVRDRFLDELLSDGVSVFNRNDKRVRKWKNDVISAGKCENCGSDNNLEAHHIIRWADYPAGRIDVKNGMCLCHKCHTNKHFGEQSYYMMLAK